MAKLFYVRRRIPNGETVPIPGRDRDGGTVCLAVLRRDGFVSLDAGENEGSVLSQPFTLSGGRLYANSRCASRRTACRGV